MSPEITRILLLTGRNEAPLFANLLRLQNPTLDVVALHDRASVELACGNPTSTTRLISVCSPVIVPKRVLEALAMPAYNFHPGPPSRPGRYPSVFALYHDDAQFGVTVHEMAAKVDSGPIVAVDWFDLPATWDLNVLENFAFDRVVALFDKLAPHLATRAEPLARLPHTWSGVKTTLAQAAAISQITPDLPLQEIIRRQRACGGHVIDATPAV